MTMYGWDAENIVGILHFLKPWEDSLWPAMLGTIWGTLLYTYAVQLVCGEPYNGTEFQESCQHYGEAWDCRWGQPKDITHLTANHHKGLMANHTTGAMIVEVMKCSKESKWRHLEVCPDWEKGNLKMASLNVFFLSRVSVCGWFLCSLNC